jgi:hypothetical protein
MNARTLTILSPWLLLACAGCVVSPPPPPPAAMMAPQPAPAPQQAAQAQVTCREFQQTITVGGTPQEAYGTSCLQPDGNWKVMSQQQSAPPQLSPPPPPPPQVVAAVPAYPSYYAYPYPYYYPSYGYYGPGIYGGFAVRGRWR